MSCSTLTFRRPVAGDLPRLAAAAAVWADGPASFPSSVPDLLAIRSSSQLVEFEERLLGFVVAAPDQSGAARLTVLAAGVDPAWRHAGLLEDLLRRCGVPSGATPGSPTEELA